MADGPEAGAAKRPRGGAARRQGARPPGGARRAGAETLRLQLHLGEKTVERLGVHCSLVHRNQSAVADEILTAWLSRYGRGRELFPAVEAGQDLGVPESGDPT